VRKVAKYVLDTFECDDIWTDDEVLKASEARKILTAPLVHLSLSDPEDASQTPDSSTSVEQRERCE